MAQSVMVHLLPQLMDATSLSGGVAVVIDVLRASTTIIHALANGAAAIFPCETVERAWQERSDRRFRVPRDRRVLLGGERHGQLISGFDLDNSPGSYTPEVVSGNTILFTTTNGTRALAACTSAARVLIGAFVNRSALGQALKADGREVHLVCAGTDGCITAEDVLFAGAVASDLSGEGSAQCDVQTQMAIDFYVARSASPESFAQTLRSSLGGRNLIALGLEADIDRAAQQDLFDIVPEWHVATNEILAAAEPGVI